MSGITPERLEDIRRYIASAMQDPDVRNVRPVGGPSTWPEIAAELLAEVHRRGPVVEPVDTEWDEYPRVKLPQDPWRQLMPVAVCPDCSVYVHDEAIHRKSHE